MNLLLKHEVAVVLMDVCMPDLDGFELASMIRQHPRYQKTAIILISAIHLADMDRVKGYEVGAVDYVPVPVVPEILRAKVSVFVDLYRKTRELESLNLVLEERVAPSARPTLRPWPPGFRKPTGARTSFLRRLRMNCGILSRRSRRQPRSLSAKPSTILTFSLHNDVIDRQSHHLTRLVEDLLDLSRISRNKLELRSGARQSWRRSSMPLWKLLGRSSSNLARN